MTCEACGNEAAWHLKTGFNAITGERYKACDRCGLQGAGDSVPDVYWPGHSYKSESLGVEFTSREQKAQYLKEHDLREAGDRNSQASRSWVEGTRDYRRKQWLNEEKPKVQKIYKDWLSKVKR